MNDVRIARPRSLDALMENRALTVCEAFYARALLSPNRPFLHWGETTWTYEGALREVREFAGWVSQHASLERPRVAMYLPNSPEAMWSWLGTLWAGRTFVPINRKHRGALLLEMLERSQASVLVTEASALEELPQQLKGFTHRILVDTGPPLPGSLSFRDTRERAATEPATPVQPACVMYTSGTTGRSKAVQVSHTQYVRGAARLVDAYGLTGDDVFHNWLPLCHLAGQLHMTMTAVICGGQVALQPTFSVSRFWDEVHRRKCSVLCGFASILHFIESLPPLPTDARSSLRVGIFAGIPTQLHARFERRFGMLLGENYGMTEIDPITCPEPGVTPPLGSCGRACPEVELAILGANDEPMPSGEVGQIAVRPRVPDVLTAQYEGDEEATLRVCRNLWFHTGDFGVLDEAGFLYFKGRAAHYIRHRGENISVAELEAVLMQHEGIAECAAVGVASELGEEDVKVVVAAKPGYVLTAEAVWQFAVAHLGSFMRPRYIELVDALPRTDVGKVKLVQLRGLDEKTWVAPRR